MPQQDAGQGACLVVGVLHGLEPQALVPAHIRKTHAIAYGVDVGIGRAQVDVDGNAVVASQADGLRQRGLGLGADTGHQQFDGMRFALAIERADARILLDKIDRSAAQAQINAGLPQRVRDMLGYFGRDGARQQAIGHLEDGDALAERCCRRGDFQADESSSQYGDRGGFGDGVAQAVRVVDGAQVVQVAQAVGQAGQAPGMGADGQDQDVVRQYRAIVERDLAGDGIDAFGARAQAQGHASIGRFRPQELKRGARILDVGLGERRAMVRQVGLGADQGDVALPAGFGQAGAQLRRSMAASHNDDSLHGALVEQGSGK